jgi:DNA-binding LytR/AlgR family response regulator
MFRQINITNQKTVYLNVNSIATIENRDGYAYIRLVDGSEYLTNEDYEEFLDAVTGTKTGQK